MDIDDIKMEVARRLLILRFNIAKINKRLKAQSPIMLLGKACLLAYFCFKVWKMIRPRFGETFRDQIGRFLLNFGAVKSQYKKELVKNHKDFCNKALKNWEQFGPLHLTLPKQGYTAESVRDLLDYYDHMINTPLKKHHFSGMIYSYSFPADGNANLDEKYSTRPELVTDTERSLSSPEDLVTLAANLKDTFVHGAKLTYLWNSLHAKEFGIGDYLQYQVVQMLAAMFGGDPKDCAGFVTSGGTESLMLMARCYRDWGVDTKAHQPGESVIICCESVHAAVMKAGEAYHVKVVLVPSNDRGDYDYVALEKALRWYGDRVVAVVASAPQYMMGQIDDVVRVAALAKKHKVGCHVDSCLGGFIVNNLDHKTDFLAIPGVTSLSADTHKNGWAPKGSSVLVMREIRHPTLGQFNLSFYGHYSIPGWTGGVYGTPKDAGSISVVNIVQAFCAMLIVGSDGYRTLAQGVRSQCEAMHDVLSEIKEVDMLIEKKQMVNVVSWRFRPGVLGHGAEYAFAHIMDSKHGFALSGLARGKLHFCVTSRAAGDPNFITAFAKATRTSIEAVRALSIKVKKGEMAFPGDAGLYGQIEGAMEPGKGEKQTTAKYIENWLLGKKGIIDAVRLYSASVTNPFFYGKH